MPWMKKTDKYQNVQTLITEDNLFGYFFWSNLCLIMNSYVVAVRKHILA